MRERERERGPYFKSLVENRGQSLPLHSGLPLGALAVVGKEVGLDVGI